MDIKFLSDRYIGFCSYKCFVQGDKSLYISMTLHNRPHNDMFHGPVGVTLRHHLISDSTYVPCYPTTWLDRVKIIIICSEL
jgi:hypothetical protein